MYRQTFYAGIEVKVRSHRTIEVPNFCFGIDRCTRFETAYAVSYAYIKLPRLHFSPQMISCSFFTLSLSNHPISCSIDFQYFNILISKFSSTSDYSHFGSWTSNLLHFDPFSFLFYNFTMFIIVNLKQDKAQWIKPIPHILYHWILNRSCPNKCIKYNYH